MAHQALSLIGKVFSDLQQVILVLLSRFLFFFLPLSHFVVFAVLHFLCIFPRDFADFLIDFFSPELFCPGCLSANSVSFYSHGRHSSLVFRTLTFGTYTQSYISLPPFPMWEVVLDFSFKPVCPVVRGNPVIWCGKDKCLG